MADEVARASGIISSLRKGGRLDEALALARRERERRPDDERLTRALSWVLCDLVRRDGGDPAALAAALRELAGLALPERGNEVLYKNLLRRLTDAAWDLRRAHDVDGLRALLGALRESVRLEPGAEWLSAGSPRSADGRLVLSTSEAEPLLRPFLSAFGGSSEDLDALVAWCGPEPFVLAEDLRHGSWEAPGEKNDASADALAGLPRTPFYVEWASPRRGAVGITAYRRSAAREYGGPSVSIERSVVRGARLAGGSGPTRSTRRCSRPTGAPCWASPCRVPTPPCARRSSAASRGASSAWEATASCACRVARPPRTTSWCRSAW